MLSVDTVALHYHRSPQWRGGCRKRHSRTALMKPSGDNQPGVLLVGLLAPANRDQ
jgi:hypothetical protein